MWGTARPEICFSASLATDSGPGSEVVVEGWAAGRGVCFLRLPPPTSSLAALAQRRPRRGLQLDGEFSLHASRHRLRAWPGGGSGDVRS